MKQGMSLGKKLLLISMALIACFLLLIVIGLMNNIRREQMTKAQEDLYIQQDINRYRKEAEENSEEPDWLKDDKQAATQNRARQQQQQQIDDMQSQIDDLKNNQSCPTSYTLQCN